MSIRFKPLVAASATTSLLFSLVFAVLPQDATASEAHLIAGMAGQPADSSAAIGVGHGLECIASRAASGA
jgi:hypothetical protein